MLDSETKAFARSLFAVLIFAGNRTGPPPHTTLDQAYRDADAFVAQLKAAGALTFSLCDQQSTPVCPLKVVSIPSDATAPLVINWPAFYWCPGGFTVQASATGLTFYAGWRQP